MGQQVFDHGKYMEDDHTIVAMMDCAEQRYCQLHLKLVIPFTRALQDFCMGMRLCCRSLLGCMILGQCLPVWALLGTHPEGGLLLCSVLQKKDTTSSVTLRWQCSQIWGRWQRDWSSSDP